MGGGGSFGKSESESDSQGQFKQDVWSGQTGALGGLYNQASNLFNQSNAGMQGVTPQAQQYIQNVQQNAMSPWLNQMQGGAYANLGLGNQLMTSLNQSMQQPSKTAEINAMIMGGEGNTYADAMAEKYRRNMDTANKNMLANLDARAAAAGMSGGSRHGIAQAKGFADNAAEYQSQMAQLGYNTFNEDLQRKLAIAQQADQATLQRQQMMQNMLGQQQQAMAGGLGMAPQMQNLGMGAFAPYMMPWQAMGQYANVIGRPTILGSGNMAGNSDAKGWGMSGYGGAGGGGGGK